MSLGKLEVLLMDPWDLEPGMNEQGLHTQQILEHNNNFNWTAEEEEEEEEEDWEKCKKKSSKNICKNTKALPGRRFLPVGQTFQACEEAGDCCCCFSLCWITPVSTRCGTSAASQGPSPKHKACAMPNLGQFLAHRGLKWMVRHIFPPLYILAVLPSSSGSSSSGAVAGYVTGMSNCRSNSYRSRLCTYQHLPLHLVPSAFGAMRNQSLSLALFISMYLISAMNSSFLLCVHASPSRGPALVVSNGIFATVDFVFTSHPSINPPSSSSSSSSFVYLFSFFCLWFNLQDFLLVLRMFFSWSF